MHDFYKFIEERFNNEDEYYRFITSVERHPEFPGYSLNDDDCKDKIGKMYMDLFAHQQYILKLEKELVERKAQLSQKSSVKEKDLKIILKHKIDYQLETIELIIKPLEYVKKTAKNYLLDDYPTLVEFEVIYANKPLKLQIDS